MCRSIAEGGQRCAAHTGPAFEAAEAAHSRGSHEWMQAASEHASTPAGAKAISDAKDQAEADGDFLAYGAFHGALRTGRALREANEAARLAVTEAELATDPSSPDFELTRTDRALLDEAGRKRFYYPDTVVALNRLAPPRSVEGSAGAMRAWSRINRLIDTEQAAQYAPEVVAALRARRERRSHRGGGHAAEHRRSPRTVLDEGMVSDLENPMIDQGASQP